MFHDIFGNSIVITGQVEADDTLTLDLWIMLVSYNTNKDINILV